jgi:hypothetical protein
LRLLTLLPAMTELSASISRFSSGSIMDGTLLD